MDHMPETGIKGVDLYFRNKDKWQYLNTGRPSGKLNEYTLVENMTVEEREYKVYLPLYDGVKNIEIGIDSSSFIIVPDRNFRKTDNILRDKYYSRRLCITSRNGSH